MSIKHLLSVLGLTLFLSTCAQASILDSGDMIIAGHPHHHCPRGHHCPPPPPPPPPRHHHCAPGHHCPPPPPRY